MAAAQDQPPATGAPTPLGGPQTAPAPSSGGQGPDAQPSDDPPPAADAVPGEFKPGIFRKAVQPVVTEGDLSGVVDGPPVGTLDDAHGGLGQAMWSGAARGDIEDLLGRIPFASADPFARSLSRRVLLTISDAPPGAARRALVTIRIEKLLQGGLIDEAGATAAALRLGNDPDFARVQAEALLYAGRDKEVCSDLTATRLTAPEPFWLQLRSWCFAASGDGASAELTRAVLEAQDIKDPALDRLTSDILAGRKTSPANIEHPTALHIYLLRKAGLPVTNAIAAKLGTAANLLAARDPRNKPADRLAAATRIASTGALSGAETVALLNAQDIPPSALVKGDADKLPYLPAQSLLRRQASLETRLPVRAAILSTAVTPYPERWAQTAQLQGDLAATIPPDSADPANRILFARTLALAGRSDAAAGWYAGAPDSIEREAFLVLIDLAAPTAARDAAAQRAISWLTINATPQKDPSPLAALALGLSDALGRPISPQAQTLAAAFEALPWASVTRRPPDAELAMLRDAAAQPGRRGEVALRVLALVGDGGPRGLSPSVLIACVRALDRAGLTADARALAVEALALSPL